MPTPSPKTVAKKAAPVKKPTAAALAACIRRDTAALAKLATAAPKPKPKPKKAKK